MRNLVYKLTLILCTCLIFYVAIISISFLYSSMSSLENWNSYYNKDFCFQINYQNIEPKLVYSNNKNILQKITIPINSPGMFNNKEDQYSINIIKKDIFDNYIKNDNLMYSSKEINSSGEKYYFNPNAHKSHSYIFEYNDYVFEIKEPYIGNSFEDSKIHEMTLEQIVPSFKREIPEKLSLQK